MCDAFIEDRLSLPAYHASMQRITVWKVKGCSRKGVERVGHLFLCKVHTRLAREGLIGEDGTLAPPADRNIARLYPHKYPKGLYDWVSKLPTVSSDEEKENRIEETS